jgi:HEAT repeat protein
VKRSWTATFAALGLTLICTAAPAEEKEGGERSRSPRFHSSLDAAMEAARRDGRPVLVVFGAEWCGACKALRERALGTGGFREEAGPLHIVEVDVDGARKTAREFAVNAVPDLVLLADEGRILARRKGAVPLAKLVRWIERGREIAASGLWQGVAPGGADEQSLLRASPGRVGLRDVPRLVAALGDPDPGGRALAGEALASGGSKAVPGLIEAAGHEYLGVRIGATELLRRMAPKSPPVDPWASADERERAVGRLSKWWEETRQLPPPRRGDDGAVLADEADPSVQRAAADAIRDVVKGDAVTRTKGMSALVGIGRPALPQVRKAITRAASSRDEGALLALEEVRWAVLVTPHLEDRFPGMRVALARGTGPEKRAAAKRLGAAGKDAFPALAELVSDPDSLVRESALRPLSGVRGPASLRAIASLLQSEDPNLRMLAAQNLGRTKNGDAAAYLVTVLDDSDEVVVITAIAALEEVKAKGEADALARCFGDERWRVRAAAAEALGKLKAAGQTEELTELLDDPDDFVVKHALEALKAVRSKLGYERLKPVIARAPSAAPTVFDILIGEDSRRTIEMAERIFGEQPVDVQIALLDKLARLHSRGGGDDGYWEPLVGKAAAHKDARIRERTANVLVKRTPDLSSSFVVGLLDDPEPGVRTAAAEVALRVAAADWGVRADRMPGRTKPGKEEKASRILDRHPEWHRSLLAHVAGQTGTPGGPDVAAVLAIFATGDGVSDLPLVAKLLDRKDLAKAIDGVAEEVGIPLVLKRLPWPEGKTLLEKACGRPFLHRSLMASTASASKEARETIFDPARIVASLAWAEGEELERLIRELMPDSSNPGGQFIARRKDLGVPIIDALEKSDRPVLRALAVYAADAWKTPEVGARAERALKDANPWVRRAAAQTMARKTEMREVLERRLAPLLSDGSPHVVAVAAVGLLTPEVRSTASLERELSYFRYEKISVWRGVSYGSSSRSPRQFEGRPPFLDTVRDLLAATKKGSESEETLIGPLALLLAQYGDESGLDRLVERWSSGDTSDIPDVIIAGIMLSGDVKYLSVLRKAAEKAEQEYKVREVLKAVRGMRGPEAREFRREINKRLRELRRRYPR